MCHIYFSHFQNRMFSCSMINHNVTVSYTFQASRASPSEGGVTTSTHGEAALLPASLVCSFCSITFPDSTLYFLHKGCHCDSNPWKCNICGEQCCNVYEFNSHLLSKSHQWLFAGGPFRSERSEWRADALSLLASTSKVLHYFTIYFSPHIFPSV